MCACMKVVMWRALTGRKHNVYYIFNCKCRCAGECESEWTYNVIRSNLILFYVMSCKCSRMRSNGDMIIFDNYACPQSSIRRDHFHVERHGDHQPGASIHSVFQSGFCHCHVWSPNGIYLENGWFPVNLPWKTIDPGDVDVEIWRELHGDSTSKDGGWDGDLPT